MKKILMFLLAAATISCLIGPVAGAEESYSIYFYVNDGDGVRLESQSFCFVGEFTYEQIAIVLFTNLIENNDPGQITVMPEGTRLLSVELRNGCLTVNLSREFLSYGGTSYEQCLVRQFAKTASVVGGVERLTILVEYCSAPLTEGLFIYETDLEEILNEGE